MLNYWNKNNQEINEKLFKYIIMHIATKRPLFQHIPKHIAKSRQKELLKFKLLPNQVQSYIQEIIPRSISTNIQNKLKQEIEKFLYHRKQYNKAQYIIFLYRSLHKIRNKKKNICFLSGRSRAIYRTFHLSRLKIREHAQFGQFLGFRKLSW